MLSSPGNQYLRPEYLTPLPTTLDAKKSPLALLAQTCSQIGADAPNAKLLQTAEKASKTPKSEPPKEKSPPSHELQQKPPPPQPREKSRSPEERSASSGSRVRTPSTSKSASNGRCASNQSATSPRASPKTPAGSDSAEVATPAKSERGSPSTPSVKTAFTPNILTSSSDPSIKDLPLGTFKPGVPVTSTFLGYPTGFPLPMDLMMSQHLKSGLSPYLNYNRMKAVDSLSGVCRDPYCTGCGVNSLAAAKTSSACPAGCTQCDHKPQFPSYAHAQLAALAAASHLPYVCNWISGDAAYCGKRFSTSEELLSHLRTHTSVSVSSESSLMSHPLLHRTYPTPPLSPLATARYHPYSKPSLLPPALGGFPLTHPGLPPYLPYSIYGPRLGAGMHP